MKTFELTFSVKTSDESDLDEAKLERYLAEYENHGLELIDIDVIGPDEAMVTMEMKAKSVNDCPDQLDLLNDEDIVDDVELFVSERVSYTSY
jgi:hypothetical protein